MLRSRVTVNHLLSLAAHEKFQKSAWNTHLQRSYEINKRHANGIIADAKGMVGSAKECRQNQIKQLFGKLKSANKWLKTAEKKLKDARKFYHKRYPKNQTWRDAKSGCRMPLACDRNSKQTNWQRHRLIIHHKKRYIAHLERQIKALKVAQVRVSVPRNQCLIVGSKGETFGNQVCQWDGTDLKFRVPACLESRFGKYVITRLGGYDRDINRIPEGGARTWHFYRKSFGDGDPKWHAAVQFTPAPVTRASRYSDWGCIGIDLNPGSIGWAYVDHQGNLKHHGKIPLQQGLPKGQQDAQIVDACLELATLASTFASPIVCENLDFSTKKESLREAKGSKYARMLSGWAYARFNQLLEAILSNRGIYLMRVNPAYTSQIGLVKYLAMYGISSDVAAGIVIARRGMRLSERLPRSVTALVGVNPAKHVWSGWRTASNSLKTQALISRRHDYYSLSNRVQMVTEKSVDGGRTLYPIEVQALPKPKGTI